MAQISLYFDDKTAEKLKHTAKLNGVSISKWVRTTVEESLEKKWPQNFFELFGSIQDDSFKAADQLSFSDDSNRAAL